MPSAEFVVMQFENHGRVIPIAVLLLDNKADRLRVRYRRDFSTIADPDDCEVLESLLEELEATAPGRSGSAILKGYEDTLSNAVRMTDRLPVDPDVPLDDALARLFAEYVTSDV
jgi:hypothetical protein